MRTLFHCSRPAPSEHAQTSWLVCLRTYSINSYPSLLFPHASRGPPLFLFPRKLRCTDDAISTTLHTALTHLDKRNTYVRMLFIDYSSAFNTIVPSKLVIKLETLGLDPALCNWVLDFLMGRPQVVRVGNNISTPLILNTVLSVHPRLRGHARLQLNHQVCGRHNSGRLDY
ncbi:unnamed protein product [Oncorhynchus mykiss]|uniref:Uncharacterized protein n=1 Tax=Oncorhynchus mykiss TaxID=8022 RepID=A0A060W7Z9_ONCMY|nr:unnamed protein product [Oncorhynchus mykiss]